MTYIGLSFTYTVVNIPMASILPSLTTDTQERTALSTTRKFFAFLGSTVVSSTALKLVDSLGKGSEALGFRIVMIIFGFIGCLLFFFTFATVKERVNTAAESVSLKESLMSLGKNKPWLIFALNIIFMWTGFFLQTSAIVYYYTAVIGSKELSVTIATIMSIVPMAANFLVPALAGRMGKRNLYVGSAAIQLAGLVVILFAGINHGAILAGAVVTALGYGMKESIYFSMQADPVDYGEWKTGVNTAGSLSAINGFLGKVAQAAPAVSAESFWHGVLTRAVLRHRVPMRYWQSKPCTCIFPCFFLYAPSSLCCFTIWIRFIPKLRLYWIPETNKEI